MEHRTGFVPILEERGSTLQNPFGQISVGVDIGSGDIRTHFSVIDPMTGLTGRIKFRKSRNVDAATAKKVDSFTANLGEGMSGGVGLIKEERLLAAEAHLRFLHGFITNLGVPRENVSVVSTEAVRVDIETRGSPYAADRLQAAFGNRLIFHSSRLEETLLLVEAVKYELSCGLIKGATPGALLPCATFGSGSAQYAYYNQGSGDILHPVSLPYGTLPLLGLLNRKGQNIATIGDLYQNGLAQNFPDLKNPGPLCVGGGVIRALHGAWNGIKGENAREKLLILSEMEPKYFRKHGNDEVRKRAPSLAMMAEIVVRTMDHTGTTDLHFIETKMVEMLAKMAHDTHVMGREPPRGLERLCGPSGPIQLRLI